MILFFTVAADDLLKASIPPGARWITVRPNGPGTDGQPVLVQPAGHDGAYRVIGGAGGKLNYLTLRGVKSEGDYKKEAAEKVQTHRDEQKRRREQDRKMGLDKSKGMAREALRAAVGDQETKFVQSVSKALGWKEADMRFPAEKYQNLSVGALKRAEAKHGRLLVKRARDAVDQQRQRLLQDAEMRSEAGLGEVPLTTEAPDRISVRDLDPVEPSTKGFGYSTDYGKRAEAAGLSKEALADEVAEAKPAGVEVKPVTGDRIRDELKAIRDPGPAVDPRATIDARQAVELLKAEKALKAVHRDARGKAKLIDAAKQPVEPKAYILEVGGPVDQDVVKDLESDLRTIRTRAFLDTIGKETGNNEESLGRHIGAGAFNSINALALAASGASLVDRSVVDVLGVAGASQVLARRLAKDMSADEMGNLREAMGRFHVDHYMNLSDQALREAREWHEMANEIEIGEAASGSELAVAQELNAKRREFTGNAQRVLGSALGEMEANAALVVALEQPAKDRVQVSLGKTSIEAAIQQARAIGLDRGDYQVERAGASTVLTVTGAGMDKLAAPVSKADMAQLRGAQDIIEGRKDEDGWLPLGVAHRPDMAMNTPPGVAPRLAQPFPQSPAEPETAIRDYIGGRMADGDTPADIMAGLLSEDTLQRAGNRQAFMAALEKTAPLYSEDGKLVRAESYQAAFEGMADEFVAKRHGADRTPLHRQKFEVDQHAVDAMHRALAEHPDGVLAFKPVGDLSAKDQGGIREAFTREYGRVDPEAEKMRADLEKLGGEEPEKETNDMFGRGINPEWREWKTNRDALAEKVNKASMTWGKYVGFMGSPARAYASMQDVLRSNVLRSFAETHNSLKPKAPLKVGKTVIANDLDHLDALDPAARERRLEERRALVDRLRDRVQGRYATGGVGDKIEAARAAEEAANQAQMGLFGEEVSAPETKTTTISRADLENEPGDHKDFNAWAGKVRTSVSDALAAGATVQLHTGEGKGVTIASVSGGQMRDDKGNPWGMLGALSHTQSRIEITHTDQPAAKTKAPELGERYTIGHAAERQAAAMVDMIGHNYKPGQPTKLWRPDMSGKYVARQRAVKLIEHDKRLVLGLGVGSGKSSIMLSGFAHLHGQGKVHKGLFLVPSIVQGQFHGEALQILEPNKFRWQADPGADRETRIKGYKDPNLHFSVVTHQAFRDDMLHLAAKREGTTPDQVSAKLKAMQPAGRKDYMRDLMNAEGIQPDYGAADESQNLLNRAGKDNSGMADVIDGVTANMPYYVSASGDPVKNDVSEAHDLLRKMDPERYADRDAFMRKYGVNTAAAKDGLKREMARHFYTGQVDPGVKADCREIATELSPEEHAEVKGLDGAAAKLRLARMRGDVDVEAARRLSPGAFEGVDEGRHEDVARQIQDSVGIVHGSAIQHAISGKSKIDALSKLAGERKGKPGVVFAHSLQRVKEIADRLKSEGHKVITLTGGDSTKVKDAKRRQYQAEGGIMVSSDAGAVGANLQKGKWLTQFDTPLTAMVHAQRRGRIHRVGQTEDVELLDLVANHPAERKARARLSNKYDLRSIMTSPLDGLDDTGLAGYLQRVRGGQEDAAQPAFMPAKPEDVPEHEPEEQGALF